MNPPILITSKGKLIKNDWAYRNLKNFKSMIPDTLPATKYIMDEQIWNDIIKWDLEDK